MRTRAQQTVFFCASSYNCTVLLSAYMVQRKICRNEMRMPEGGGGGGLAGKQRNDGKEEWVRVNGAKFIETNLMKHNTKFDQN